MNRFLALIGIMTVGLLSGCKPTVSAKNTGAIYCVDSFSQYLNPQVLGSSPFAASLSQQLYNRLVQINPVTQRLEGALAESWNVSHSGLIYTFTLRKDIPFHTTSWFTPSRLMNADDIVFSFDRIINPENPFHALRTTHFPFFDNLDFENTLTSVRKIDDYQVQFVLSHPSSAFLSALASDYAVILSDEYANQLKKQKNLNQLDEYPVGTGPFLLSEKRNWEYLRLARNPLYWDTHSDLQQVIFDYTPRASKRLTKLFTGECQVISSPAASQLPFIHKNPRTALDIQNSMNTTFMVLNTRKKPFNDKRVREAIAMAVNKENLQQAVFFDTGETANSLLPPASWANDPNLEDYPNDIEQAQKLLRDAGYPDGLTLTLWVQPTARTYNPDVSKTAQILQSDLAKIGIDIEIVETRWSYMRDQMMKGNHDLALMTWIADNDDPDNFLRPLLSCNSNRNQTNNYSGWCNREFDSMLDEALATQRLSERIMKYHQAQEVIFNQIPVVPLAHALTVSAYSKNLQDLIMPPTGGVSFVNAHLEE